MAITTEPNRGPMAQPKEKRIITKFMVFDGKVHEIHTVVVHRFKMSDSEDPDLYAAVPLMEWQKSEMGKWVMERAVDTPEWHRQADTMQYHLYYAVIAKLKDIDYTFWALKWGNDVDKKT